MGDSSPTPPDLAGG